MDELGWFGSKAVRKVKNVAKRRVRPVARKIYAPISAVERVVRPIGKKIPIVGTFAQLHEDITEPLERKILGLSPAKAVAANRVSNGLPEAYGAIASTLASSDLLVGAAQVGGKLLASKRGIMVAGKAFSKGAAGYRLVQKLGAKRKAEVARALVARAKTDPIAAKSIAKVRAALSRGPAPRALRAPGVTRGGVYTVIAPDGRKVLIPASAV